jgi:hypothetical protein
MVQKPISSIHVSYGAKVKFSASFDYGGTFPYPTPPLPQRPQQVRDITLGPHSVVLIHPRLKRSSVGYQL